ncbi:MAG: CbiX/SirB N-terminal domain-containing protein [Casimicrobiaceae bacterium]
MTTGLVLFAHGARDPRWAEPFERLRHKVSALRPGAPVTLAFLELMAPDLTTACATLVAQGASRIRIVPIFLGQGGHVRQDLPALAMKAQALYPATPIELATAIGDDDAVLDRIAAVCVGAGGN